MLEQLRFLNYNCKLEPKNYQTVLENNLGKISSCSSVKLFFIKVPTVSKCKVPKKRKKKKRLINAVGNMAFSVHQACSSSNMCVKKHAWEHKTKHRLWDWPGRCSKRSGFSSPAICFVALGKSFNNSLVSHLRHITRTQILNTWLLLWGWYWGTTAKGPKDNLRCSENI